MWGCHSAWALVKGIQGTRGGGGTGRGLQATVPGGRTGTGPTPYKFKFNHTAVSSSLTTTATEKYLKAQRLSDIVTGKCPTPLVY